MLPTKTVRPGAGFFADYVYGTIATLVAALGLSYDSHPDALTAGAILIVGAIAIWMAHSVSRLVAKRSQTGPVELSQIAEEFRSSWPIVSAAIPSTVVMFLAELGVYSTKTGLALSQGVGVLALAGVGLATAGGPSFPVWRRIAYVTLLTAVGVFIVVLEAGVHRL